jgi:Fe-S-cluster containining protein
LHEAIEALPSDVFADVAARMKTLEESSGSDGDPITCPLLDLATGACRVYEARPLACRTYGFYTSYDGGRWCARIEASGIAETVVVGNLDAFEQRMDAELGETASLLSWWRRSTRRARESDCRMDGV